MTRNFILLSLAVTLSGLLCVPSMALSAKTKKRVPKRPPVSQSEEKAPQETSGEAKPEALGPEDKRTEQEKQEQTKAAQEASGPKEKAAAEEDREMEAEEAQRLTELFLRNQSVFIRKGELMIELNTFYNRNSRRPSNPFPVEAPFW